MKKNILHLLYFLSIILILLISIKFADESDNAAFRYKNFFNLGKLNNDDILVNFAITRQAWGNIRLGYLEEKKEKNKVLVLGNHTINNFTRSTNGIFCSFFRFYFVQYFLNSSRRGYLPNSRHSALGPVGIQRKKGSNL